MSLRCVRLGFVPLTDCAPLVIAHELGFAEEEGLSLTLEPSPSWATLRDRLALGDVDAAHMLAPVPIAHALGLGPGPAAMEALHILSLNGTIIGLSRPFAVRLRDKAPDLAFGDAPAARDALLAMGPIRLAVPFAFSMHRELIHRWLGNGPELSIRTVPPSLMSEALAAGEIDAFCVGEPWGSLAVEAGLAELILPGRAIWMAAPEKALVARAGWAGENPEVTGALLRALWRAGGWLADPARRATAADILARDAYLDRPAEILERAMTGHLAVGTDGTMRHVPDFVRFHDGAANFPWRSQAAWIGAQLARRFTLDPLASAQAAARVFRSDLYRAHLSGTGAVIPGASSRVEGALATPTAVAASEGRLILSPDAFFDGRVFDPDGHLPDL